MHLHFAHVVDLGDLASSEDGGHLLRLAQGERN
jgi:hypothetical protein